VTGFKNLSRLSAQCQTVLGVIARHEAISLLDCFVPLYNKTNAMFSMCAMWFKKDFKPVLVLKRSDTNKKNQVNSELVVK